ncbi:uncharacterized protein K441DRAFT_655146 [Cenococcum geophilum 1.58]|uniref:uncharacterized protein n=1 Tax=Cenococcum geophilum 1.58 TaxID=794803 RepID=UPI00358E9F39|nr:hypothetical protein K441DRAFT_655146 [Cenococcum geophilum 1.58]
MSYFHLYLLSPLGIAKIVGITAPALYCGITFAYNAILLPPLLSHAPPKLLAKEWLQAYQYGPTFVRPLIISSTISNALLAYYTTDKLSNILYIVAAISSIAVMPLTLLYMEPGINGAAKWKVQELLRDEGFQLKENTRVMPRVDRQTARESTRRWAEKTDMREIVTIWGKVNRWRWVMTAIGIAASAHATCCPR